MSGHNWMNGSVEDARALGIVKTVEDIRLTNESKKKFKDGISYDTFSQDEEAFAIVHTAVDLDVGPGLRHSRIDRAVGRWWRWCR